MRTEGEDAAPGSAGSPTRGPSAHPRRPAGAAVPTPQERFLFSMHSAGLGSPGQTLPALLHRLKRSSTPPARFACTRAEIFPRLELLLAVQQSGYVPPNRVTGCAHLPLTRLATTRTGATSTDPRGIRDEQATRLSGCGADIDIPPLTPRPGDGSDRDQPDAAWRSSHSRPGSRVPGGPPSAPRASAHPSPRGRGGALPAR